MTPNDSGTPEGLPVESGANSEILALLDAYLADLEAGRAVDPRRLIADHPHLAGPLRSFLAVMDLADRVAADSSGDGPASPLPTTACLTPGARSRGGLPSTFGPGSWPPSRLLLRDLPDEREPLLRPCADSGLPAAGGAIGKYQVQGEIARGGMGAVLRGRDVDLGRELAIKVLLDPLRRDPDVVRRFVEEAQIGGQLQHPGIVPVYELGTFPAPDGRPFFAMKLVRGRTLASLLKEAPAAREGQARLLGIFLQVAQTVAYAHARGVIHRDLKPSNVMVGSFGEVQVMDWGLAKVLPRGGAEDDERAGGTPPEETIIATTRSAGDGDRSQAGSVLGTPAYMAPEQARGEVERLDERCDVFALGSILCEILTGRPAFAGRSPGEIQRKAARGETAEALARLASCGAEADLVALARDCLAADPEDRPRDAAAVAARVTAYLAGVQERLHASERERAVAEARASEERRKRKWQLGLAASIAASLLLGGIGLAAFTTALDRQKNALARANADLKRQRERAEANEAAAIDAVKRFHDAVANNPELKDNLKLEPLRKALLNEPLAFFRSLRDRLQADGQTTPEALARLASASFKLGNLTAEIGDKQDALATHRETLAIRQRLADAHPVVT